MEEIGERPAKLTSFRNIWNRLLPHIVRTKPMSDLCWECQKNNAAVYRSANLPDIVKCAKLKKQMDHLQLVAEERTLYRDMVTECKTSVVGLKLGHNPPCSRDIKGHYSFDFAQQVHIPSNPLQPGPIYFLVPRKCGIFGVSCEGIPQQVNYLIDEGMCSSKGSNAVISYLHHFFENYGRRKDVHLHCDNCSGQNKKKFVVWYFAWRVMNHLHLNLSLNFMIVGHTKFGPDWCFGLLKQNFRRTEVCSLEEMAACVKKSSTSGVNMSQLVGDESGKVLVPMYDWQKFLTPFFKPLPGIKKLQHMRFDSKQPGLILVKDSSDCEETAVQVLKDVRIRPPAALPVTVAPPGLDKKRQWYLFAKIREFCTESTQDIVCPRPAGQVSESSEDEEEIRPPPAKKSHRNKRVLKEKN
ncbi:LOW QUALITY PROTEIN: uncharacterized protein LOC121367205 [Gigantopelta aegis]|uniref:LOW QUALITY PROTEIN: uncharacterized protein LOC121367205 n=1 Tax=Gigantopelta aegis TaxID=1735272 RepID=UPI001B88C7D0|nr:LOW QUALITY PROTEIN: uncharacterized protein LOC121367205 [Gigantopelta aegis]